MSRIIVCSAGNMRMTTFMNEGLSRSVKSQHSQCSLRIEMWSCPSVTCIQKIPNVI